MKITVHEKFTTTAKYSDSEAYYNEYKKHLHYGSSGVFSDSTGIGTISSHAKECRKLEKAGYINLNFANGGDDDILLVDHTAKQYGFFERPMPSADKIKQAKSLRELWMSC